MKYRTRSEPREPRPESLVLLEEAVNSIDMDGASVPEWGRKYLKDHRRRMAFDLDLIHRYFQGRDRVLDIGAIPPVLTCALHGEGYDIAGVDLAPERFQSTLDSTGIKVIKCDVEKEELPFPDNSFGGVIFNEMFEHLRINPIFTMKEILRVLRPGGMLLLSTPNLRSLKGIFNYIFRGQAYSCSGGIYEQYEKLDTIGHMGHVREYTVKEVCGFLEKSGFRIKEIVRRGNYEGMLANIAMDVIPALRPYITVVATK